jgi:hypothetical protein
MTVREMVAQSRSLMGKIGKLFYISGTTDTIGAADGTTLILATLTEIDDAFNGGEAKITSGAVSGERREVVDFASGTITVEPAFTKQIASGINFEVGAKHFISDFEIVDLFTACQDELITLLPPDAFPGHSDVLEIVATAGSSAALPPSLAGPPNSMQFRASDNEEYDVTILPPGEKDRFRDDAFLGSNVYDMVAIFENAIIKYRPVSVDGTLLLPVIPKLDTVTFAGGSKLPTYMHHLQVKYAAWKALEARERLDLAGAKKQAFFDVVGSITARYSNITKQMQTDE